MQSPNPSVTNSGATHYSFEGNRWSPEVTAQKEPTAAFCAIRQLHLMFSSKPATRLLITTVNCRAVPRICRKWEVALNHLTQCRFNCFENNFMSLSGGTELSNRWSPEVIAQEEPTALLPSVHYVNPIWCFQPSQLLLIATGDWRVVPRIRG